MAERRMFAKTIIDSDAFLDMPTSTQALYFHLGMRADDEGFINKPKSIMRLTGSKDDDLKLLIAKNFVIPFESGVVVIKHWKIHNYIRADRIKETVYTDEKASLDVKENDSYTVKGNENGRLELELSENCPSIVRQVSVKCPHRLGKDSIDILCANFFEQIWQMYPNKRGKAQVSASKKQCLHDIGLEEMTRAINRYKKDLANEPWRKPQNGSTFFNSGYVDYLDANYEDKPIQTAKPVQPSEIPEGWL